MASTAQAVRAILLASATAATLVGFRCTSSPSHGRYVTFQLAEVAVPRGLFREILRLIDDPRPSSTPARLCLD